MVTLDDAGRNAPILIFPSGPPVLSPFVEHAWIQRRSSASEHSSTRRIVPDASAHLIVTRSHDGDVRGKLVGSRSTYCDVQVNRHFTVGVRLKPGTIPVLARASARDLVDREVPLSDVIEDGGRVLEAASAGLPDETLDLLLDALGQQLRGLAAPDWRANTIGRLWQDARDLLGVAESARQVGMATRTLHKVSTDAVGLSPSQWQRITRLHRSIGVALAKPDRSMSRVAAEVGFHDQSHMVREFKAFVGEAPTQFLSRGACRSVQERVQPRL